MLTYFFLLFFSALAIHKKRKRKKEKKQKNNKKRLDNTKNLCYNLVRKGGKIMEFLKVNNKNMYISRDGKILKSYNKIIIIKKDGEIFINSNYYNYSPTTSRHRNLFLDVSNKEFERNCRNGLYNFISDDEMLEMYYGLIS